MHRRLLLATFVALAAAAPLAAQTPARLTPTDVDRLLGPRWEGILEYKDYSSGKQTTIKSTLDVTRGPALANGSATWELRVGYNDEPNANSSETAVLSADGRTFRGEQVTERTLLPDGTLRLVTEQEGSDNNQPARFRFVYLLGKAAVSIQKLVRFGADEAFFERNIYRWGR
jgi:hypothetical protein